MTYKNLATKDLRKWDIRQAIYSWGIGIKFKDHPIHNLHELKNLPIIECDLSELDFDLKCLNREKKIHLSILPDKTKLPFSELNSFRLTRLKATKASSSDFGSLSGHPLEILELLIP